MSTTSRSSSSPDAVPLTRRRRIGQRGKGALRVLNPPRLPLHTGAMDDAVRAYIDAIAPKVGRRRLFVGVWRHGVSIYGWQRGRDAGSSDRHPQLMTSKGTIRLRPEDAAGIGDEEFRDLVRAALDG